VCRIASKGACCSVGTFVDSFENTPIILRIRLFRIKNKVQIAMDERRVRGISQRRVYEWRVPHFAVFYCYT
jgi:hypothetical protein